MTLHALTLALLLAWPVYHAVLICYGWCGTRAGGPYGPPCGLRPDEFWLIIPCLNEERVIARTVTAALPLSAPGARTNVLVIDDGSDDATPQVLARIADPNLHVLRRDLPDARQGKGAALNAAYRHIRDRVAAAGGDPHRTVIGIIDADGRGTPNLLDEVATVLSDSAVGAVQCRVRIHNRDRVLGALQDIEFGCIANASQVLRDRVGMVGLGGNGQFTRLSVLQSLGDAPWSDCLVEDLELGLRLHLAGTRIRYASRAAISQQALVDVARLIRQRTRWAQGNLQCIRYLPAVATSREIRNTAMLESMHYLLAPWLNALGMVLLGLLWTVAAARAALFGAGTTVVGSTADLAQFTALWAALLFLPGLLWAFAHRLHLRDEALSRCLLAGVLYPGFLALGLVSSFRAIGRHLSGRTGWVKTERLNEELASTGPGQLEAGWMSGQTAAVRRALRELTDAGLLNPRMPKVDARGLALTGSGGFLAELVKAVLERGLQAELTEHLGYERDRPTRRCSANSRNGTTPKVLLTDVGKMRLGVPRDRAGSFVPRLVPKGSRSAGGLDEVIISLYAGGMSTRDLRHDLDRRLGSELSGKTISKIAEAMAEEVKAWQHRRLLSFYPIVYVDAVLVTVRDGNQIRHKSAHLVVGVGLDGVKHVLGMWVQANEGAEFWTEVCAEVRDRGVQELLFVCCHELDGLSEAIAATWPQATVRPARTSLLAGASTAHGWTRVLGALAARYPARLAPGAPFQDLLTQGT